MTKKTLTLKFFSKARGIVDALEDNDVSLEESVKKFEEGLSL